MKYWCLFIFTLLFVCTTASYANNSSIEASHITNVYTDSKKDNQAQINNAMSLLTTNTHFSLRLKLHNFTTYSYAPIEKSIQIKSQYQTQFASFEIGMVQSYDEISWNKSFVQGTIIIHKNNNFSLVVLANIEQLNSANFHYSPAQILENTIVSNEPMLNYSFGLMSNYSINEAWHFSGGIIHSETTASDSTTLEPDDNMALIGTTYSF